jgi:hypothetical protein
MIAVVAPDAATQAIAQAERDAQPAYVIGGIESPEEAGVATAPPQDVVRGSKGAAGGAVVLSGSY